MVAVGTISIDLVANTGRLLKPVRNATRSLNKFASNITGRVSGALRGLTRQFGGAATAALGLGGALSTAGLIGRSLQLASNMENAQVAFTTFLKDSGKATTMLANLKKFSDATPFTGAEVREAGKQLLAFGFEAERIEEFLQVMGDAAAGSQKPIADFVDILGKVRASGVASMGDVNRLADRGVPIFAGLAQQMGVASDEVRKMVGAGKVGFNDMWQTMKNVTSGTGLFAGAMADLSKTTSGRLSTLTSKIDEMFAAVGKGIIEKLNITEMTNQLGQFAVEFKDTFVNAVLGGVDRMIKGFFLLVDTIHAVRTGFAQAQLGIQMGMVAVVKAVVTTIKEVELLAETAASVIPYAFAIAQQSVSHAIGILIQDMANLITWIESKLPDAMQTGLGAVAQEFAGTFADVAAQQAAAISKQDYKVDLTFGDSAKEFAGILEQDLAASQAKFDTFASREKLSDRIKDSMKVAEKSMDDQLVDFLGGKLKAFFGGGGAVSSGAGASGLDIGDPAEIGGALAKGSQEAFKAILGTSDKELPKKQLDEAKKQTHFLEGMWQGRLLLGAADLLGFGK